MHRLNRISNSGMNACRQGSCTLAGLGAECAAIAAEGQVLAKVPACCSSTPGGWGVRGGLTVPSRACTAPGVEAAAMVGSCKALAAGLAEDQAPASMQEDACCRVCSCHQVLVPLAVLAAAAAVAAVA